MASETMGEIADQIGDNWLDYMWGEDDDVIDDADQFDGPIRRPEPDNPRVTRALKCKAHRAFDRIWKSGRMSRSRAYTWLFRELGVPASKAHMAAMDRHDVLERVIEVSDRLMGPLAAEDFPDDEEFVS